MKKVQSNPIKKFAHVKAYDREHDDGNDGLCVVCFRSVEIYSVGDCDHPVCYECSTRMRVLIAKNECPICRQEMSQVVFVTKKNLVPYRALTTRNMSYERRYCIYFETDKEMQAYDKLLDHSCPICPLNTTRPFSNFQMLKDHVLKIHQLFYCELCIEHLKIFSRERRAYTRQELAQHRRKGDPDNTSHRGHPLCEFCDTRYMDNDELYRHLRKDHFYCHFCDTDGLHQYFDDYNALRKHFGACHFLCEEGDCRNEQFTSVFRNKLDMQAHFLETHAGTKQAIRQARTVDIEFTLNHSPQLVERGGQGRGRGGRGRGGRGGRMGRGDDDGPTEAPPTPPPPQHSIDINCVQDFPTLGGQGASDPSSGRGGGNAGSQNRSFTLRAMRGNVASMQEEFPSLINPATTSVNVVTTTGSPSSSAYSAYSSSIHPTTSVHLKVNSKKGIVGGASNGGGGGSRSAVSIQYNRTAGGDRGGIMSASNGSLGGGKQGGNITLKSKVNNVGSGVNNKENADFPSLGQPSKSLGDTFKTLNDFTSGSGPLYSSKSTPFSSNSSSRVSSAKTNGKAAGIAKNFNQNDFPTLAVDSQQDQYMKNYHGMSKVTVPVSNSWTKTTEYVPKPQAPVKTPSVVLDNSSSKAKKKKGNNTQSVAPSITAGAASSSQDFNSHATNKKRPLRLGNVFDNSDNDEPKVSGYTFAGPRRRGDVLFSDYNAVSAPAPTSSVRVVSAAEVEATRKKSELKIGSLKNASAPAFNSLGDFPSLGGAGSCTTTTSSSSNSKKKNGSNPVGGGDSWTSVSSSSGNNNNSSTSKKAQKNGLKPSNFSNTDMTFHSSYGESFPISPSEETPHGSFTPAVRSSSRASNTPSSKGSTAAQKQQKKESNNKKQFEFIHPPDFEERNQQLIKTISELCGGNSDKFNQFKKLAGNFRNGRLSGREYYQQCRQLMGRATLLSMLPELLVLLPDITKQQAVFTSFKQTDDHHSNNTNNNSKTSGTSESLQFDECAICGQVLSPRDYDHHVAKHNLNDVDFPSLKSVSASLS